MRKLLQLKLKVLAKLILKKHRPIVVGLTGSIGKTSAKEAIYLVLKDKFRVRTSYKNYNNEIGLPLTIIGRSSPGRDLFGWVKLFFKAARLAILKDKNYPEILVLEMGVDHPGDMDYLLSIAPATVGLVTAVSYSHIEYFGSLINIKKEKQTLIEKLDKKGLAVLNYDNEYTREMKEASQTRVLTYGFKPGADLQAQDVSYNFLKGDYELAGINFKLNYNGSIVPVMMKNVLSETAIYAALAAAAVGIYFDLNIVDIAQSLGDFSLPAGRMNVLPGIKHSFIIDDSYNSSPEAALAAISVLSRIKVDEAADKYAVLGDMLEIGHYTEEGHRLVGSTVAKQEIDYLLAVGEYARDFLRGAEEAGMSKDRMFHFDTAEEAGKFLQDRLKAGDVLLVKGSQGARMEKVVKELMAEPERAAELIVRQGEEWTDK